VNWPVCAWGESRQQVRGELWGGAEKEAPREGANRGLGVETGVGVACGKTWALTDALLFSSDNQPQNPPTTAQRRAPCLRRHHVKRFTVRNETLRCGLFLRAENVRTHIPRPTDASRWYVLCNCFASLFETHRAVL
jgi:hypothetical protein